MAVVSCCRPTVSEKLSEPANLRCYLQELAEAFTAGAGCGWVVLLDVELWIPPNTPKKPDRTNFAVLRDDVRQQKLRRSIGEHDAMRESLVVGLC